MSEKYFDLSSDEEMSEDMYEDINEDMNVDIYKEVIYNIPVKRAVGRRSFIF